MPENTNPIIDPDGQAVIHALIGAGGDPADAYNATQGIRNMSGEQVITRLDAMEASTNARLDAMEASTNARLDALEATTSALETTTSALEATTGALETTTRVLAETTDARLNAIDAQLDIMGWAIIVTLALVGSLVGSGLLSSFRSWRRAESPPTAAAPARDERKPEIESE